MIPTPNSQPPAPATLDGVAALVDRSLLRQETGREQGTDLEPRLGMLGTIREFARDRLTESGEAVDLQRAHAAFYLQLAEEAALSGPQQAEWVRRLSLEHENLRATLRWFEEMEDWEAMLRLTAALAASWYLRGHLREGVVWLDRVLERTTGRGDALRASALLGAGHLHWELGNFGRAQTRLEECLRIADALNDITRRARTLMHLGLVAEKQGDDERARGRFEECLALFQSIGDEGGVSDALMNLGDVAYRQRDWARSAAWTEEGLALCRTIGDRFTLAGTLGNAAQLALRQGDVERAFALNREALEESAEIRHTHGVADGLAGIGAVALGLGRPTAAARFLGVAAALCEELGAGMVPHHGQFNDTLAEVRSRLGKERFAEAWAGGRALSAEQAVAEAMTLVPVRLAEPDRALEAASGDGSDLSTREIDVLRLLVTGQSDREIGSALFISSRTAQGHVASILAKLGAKTRTAAVVVAIRRGVIAAADASAVVE